MSLGMVEAPQISVNIGSADGLVPNHYLNEWWFICQLDS